MKIIETSLYLAKFSDHLGTQPNLSGPSGQPSGLVGNLFSQPPHKKHKKRKRKKGLPKAHRRPKITIEEALVTPY